MRMIHTTSCTTIDIRHPLCIGAPHLIRTVATEMGRLALLLVGLIILLGATSRVEAANVSLAWDPSTNNVDGTPLTDLAGYKIYYGTTSQVYAAIIDVGPVTTATVTNLPAGVTYFFVVTCYDTFGVESVFSQELAWTPTLSGGSGAAEVPQMLCPHEPAVAGEIGISVSWSSVAGVRYAVQRSSNLMALPAFTTIVSQVPGQGPITSFTDTTATGNGPYYYRVQAEP